MDSFPSTDFWPEHLKEQSYHFIKRGTYQVLSFISIKLGPFNVRHLSGAMELTFGYMNLVPRNEAQITSEAPGEMQMGSKVMRLGEMSWVPPHWILMEEECAVL